jgi:hypothetical protein
MSHHYSVPQVREIVSQPPRALDASGVQRPVSQRELVAASLLLRPPSSLPKKV